MQGGKVKKNKIFLEKDTEKERAHISPLKTVEPLVLKMAFLTWDGVS